MRLSRRHFIGSGASALSLTLTSAPSFSQTPPGVVLLHGKRSSPDAALGGVAALLASAGCVVAAPDLPWSSSRYLSGTWSGAMDEIGAAVASVAGRAGGRVMLVGHSMGCPAAMAYAGRDRRVKGLVLTAAGHSPRTYVRFSPEVAESIERARAMVRGGRSNEAATFYDNNQGSVFSVQATAGQFLSYFDPAGPCEMANSAGRVSCPVLWVIGTNDRAIEWADPIARRLTRGAKSRYLAVPGAGHGNTPSRAADEIVAWIRSV